MVAPIILKSYNDSGDKNGGSYWQIDFTNISSISEPEDAGLDQSPTPMMDSTKALIFDFLGSTRRVTISGTRGNGDLNDGVAMSNSDWILAIRSKMNGQQGITGPFRLVKQFENSEYWPNETVYCAIASFSPSMAAGVPTEISYSLELLVGEII